MNTHEDHASHEATVASETLPAASADGAPRGHVGRIVTATIVGGLVVSLLAVIGPFAGAEEHVITTVGLAVFAASWAGLAWLTTRWTDQPQRWAWIPAGVLVVAALFVLVVAPTGNEAGWIWPPAILALVTWMVVRSRRELRSRTRVLVLYPVFAALALSAIGGLYETYAESRDSASPAMPGRLVDVGGHQLHISCTGAGSPTVVLEPGLGEISAVMAGWIAPDLAATTRVCVYDRAGRGWSQSAGGPQDGVEVATDLHTLLERAGEPGPYVLAGHSSGGIYVLNFARLFPRDTAGVVLLDSMHPEQYDRMPSWPRFYEMFRRASAVMPTLSRFGVSRLINATSYGDLPEPQRTQERELLSTPEHNRSVRDEFNQIRTAMAQAAELETLGDLPLVVVTAQRGQEAAWFEMQTDLVGLSTNSAQVEVADATHETLLTDRDNAEQAAQAIDQVVAAVRAGSPLGDGATAGIARPTEPVDEIFDLDGVGFHLHCTGAGDTTVVLIAGWGAAGDESWSAVQPTLAEQARVCTYDRPGTGTSDAPVTDQTFETQAADLRALLALAGEPGPYVVVGHSFGGLEAITFAAQLEAEVTGLVLVDASPTNWPAAVCAVRDDGSEAAGSYHELCGVMHDPSRDPERLDVVPAFRRAAAIATLGDLPMTVITADTRTAPGLAADELDRLDEAWAAGVATWAALSEASTVVTVTDTGHNIQLEHPEIVVREVTALLATT